MVRHNGEETREKKNSIDGGNWNPHASTLVHSIVVPAVEYN